MDRFVAGDDAKNATFGPSKAFGWLVMRRHLRGCPLLRNRAGLLRSRTWARFYRLRTGPEFMQFPQNKGEHCAICGIHERP